MTEAHTGYLRVHEKDLETKSKTNVLDGETIFFPVVVTKQPHAFGSALAETFCEYSSCLKKMPEQNSSASDFFLPFYLRSKIQIVSQQKSHGRNK